MKVRQPTNTKISIYIYAIDLFPLVSYFTVDVLRMGHLWVKCSKYPLMPLLLLFIFIADKSSLQKLWPEGFDANLCSAHSPVVDDACQNGPWTNKTATQIIIIKVFLKRKILSLETILSMRTHTRTQRHPHTQAFWLYKAKYTQQTPRRLGMDKDTQNRKHSRSTILGKEMFLDLIWMSPERVSAGEEGEGHSMLMDRKQKRRGNQQWRVWCDLKTVKQRDWLR